MVDEWRELRLGDLVAQGALSISDGYRVRNEELGPEGIPFVRGGDIGDGWINTTTIDHIRPELADRVRAKLAHPGDVAFITKGTVGRAGLLRQGQPAVVFAPQVAYWRVLEPNVLDPRFLFYLIRSHAFQSALNGVKTRGSMVADYVSISLQHEFAFKFPDIHTQRAVAHILGTLDDKIEVNRRTNETLEARALFKSWFVDFDPVRAKAEGRAPGLPKPLADLFSDAFEDSEMGELPKGWAAGSVDAMFDLTMGQSPPGESYNESGEGLPFFQGRADFTFRFPTRRIYCSAPTRFAKAGDTLVSVRAPVGDINMAAEDCAIGRGVAAVRYKTGSRSFTYYSMRSLEGDFAKFEAEGTVFGSINKKDFHNLACVAPGPAVVHAFERIVGPFDDRIRSCELGSNTLAALRDTLLPKLISGELRVKDAEKLVEAAT
jgi:type I restriction enzyme S subunit